MSESTLALLAALDKAVTLSGLKKMGIGETEILKLDNLNLYISSKKLEEVYRLPRSLYSISPKTRFFGVRKDQFDKVIKEEFKSKYITYLLNSREYCEGSDFFVKKGIQK